MEKINENALELPHDGVVTKLEIQNVSDFLNIFDKLPFKVLSKLEDEVVGKKIRKLEKTENILSEGGRVTQFNLVGYNKTEVSQGVDEYTVSYRYSAIM